MARLNRTNKPNIRTKHSANGTPVRRTKVTAVQCVSMPSMLMVAVVALVTLPHLALSLSLPSASPSPSVLSSVLLVDPIAAQIHIRLATTLPYRSIISSSAVSTSNPNSKTSQPNSLLPTDIFVRPTFSPVDCDQDAVRPLDVVKLTDNLLIVTYRDVVAFGNDPQQQAFLCLTEGGQVRHMGEASRFIVKR